MYVSFIHLALTTKIISTLMTDDSQPANFFPTAQGLSERTSCMDYFMFLKLKGFN